MARALTRVLGQNKGIECETIDMTKERYTLAYGLFADLWKAFYSASTKQLPWMYGLFYHLTNNEFIWKVINAPKYDKLRKNMRARLIQKKPDIVVSLVPVVNKIVMDAVESLPFRIPFVIVMGDPVTFHRSWIEPRAEWISVGSEIAKKRFVSQGVHADKIKVTGVPIDPRFYGSADSKKTARRQYGLDQDKYTVLLLGGGEGSGKILPIVKKLVKGNLPINIVVVCGKNKKMRQKLSKYPIKVFGYTYELHKIMDAVDLVITKAGPSTIEECSAKNLPLVITGHIPGQEKGNVHYARSRTQTYYTSKAKKIIQIINERMSSQPEEVKPANNLPVIQIAKEIRATLKQ